MPAEDFPRLNDGQVALYRAMRSTGQILNANYVRPGLIEFINSLPWWSLERKKLLAQTNIESSEIYSVFDSQCEAIKYIDSHKDNQPNAEFYIKDHNEQLIYVYPD